MLVQFLNQVLTQKPRPRRPKRAVSRKRVSIEEANSSADYLAALRLRYKVYVEEMGRPQKYADSITQTVEEPLDEEGRTFVVKDDSSRVMGTYRVNPTKETSFSNFPIYNDLYDIPHFDSHYPGKVLVATKLMLDPGARGLYLFLEMCRQIVRTAIDEGCEVILIDTSPNLLKAYKRLGCKEFKDTQYHPEYGEVTPLMFSVNDVDYLREINSPLLPVYEQLSAIA